MKKYFILIIALFTFSIYAQDSSTKQIPEVRNFILENIDGDLIELIEEIGDGPILISFWATWCKPCKEELREFNKIYERYSESGLKMFAISVDNEKSIAKVKPYIKSNQFNFPVLLDQNSEVARLYYAQMVPYSLIINKEGKIVYTHFGYKKGDELQVEEIIKNLTNK